MHAEVAQLLRSAEHRLHDERRRDLARDAEQDSRLDHRLGEEREVGRPGSRQRRDGVHRRLRHAHDAAEMEQRLLGERELRVAGLRTRADPGHAFVHGRGRVRHRTHDGHALRDPLLDVRRPDRGGD